MALRERSASGVLAVCLSCAAACGGASSSSSGAAHSASTLLIVSGNTQTAQVGQELPQPVVVRVLDTSGNPVAGQVINFRVVSGGGTVFAGTAISSQDGMAQERWSLGSAAGHQELQARAVDPVTGAAIVFASFDAVATAGPPRSLAVAGGDAQTAVQGTALPSPLQIVVSDAFGNPVGGAGVQFTVTAGSGTTSPTASRTDARGAASTTWTLGAALGVQTLSATVAGLSPVTFTATSTSSGGSGLTCSQDQKPVTTSEAAAVGWAPQSLGAHGVGDVVQFTVPPGTASVTIVEQARQAPDKLTSGGYTLDNTAVPVLVKDPGGAIVYDDTNAPTRPGDVENALVFFASSSPATGTLTLPDATGGLTAYASGLPSGTWSLTVSDYAYECTLPPYVGSCSSGASATSVYDVTIIPKPAGVATKTLDVTFWLATAKAGFTAATAQSDPSVQRLLSSLATFLTRGGVTLGRVAFQDLSSDLQATYDTNGVNVDETGACADLGQMLKHSTAGTGDTVNVFLVSNLVAASQNNTQVVGIDGTIPGPATFAGTVASGVAASVIDLHAGASYCGGPVYLIDANGHACGADVEAYIVAHEMGHTLGLYHVTEGGGDHFDPLASTPRCTCSSCAPTPSQCGTSSFQGMQVAWCNGSTSGCGGGDNLMFWLLDTGAVGNLLPEQGTVMQLNPLVH